MKKNIMGTKPYTAYVQIYDCPWFTENIKRCETFDSALTVDVREFPTKPSSNREGNNKLSILFPENNKIF